LVLLDLDRFKPINDEHGHAAGDAMLRAVAQAIASCVRGGDLLSRLGGDEFALVLDHCPDEVAGRIAEDVRRTVSNLSVRWHDKNLCVGVSVGVAALTDDLPDAASWLAAADTACYEAKSSGRNSVRHAKRSPLRQVVVTRIGLA
jgi:diguanylate cyclase (GGDEF)-like protein